VSGAIARLRPPFLIKYIARLSVESRRQKKKLLKDMQQEEEQSKKEKIVFVKIVEQGFPFTMTTCFAKIVR
jgi:hypothetical protein